MPPKTAAYKSPRAPLGLVKWSPGIGHSWFPAIVTSNDGNSIRLMVFPSESRVARTYESVRHVTDPQFPKLLDQAGGVWDFTDEYKLLAGLAQLKLIANGEWTGLPTPELLALRPLVEGLVYIPRAEGGGSDPGDDPDYVGA